VSFFSSEDVPVTIGLVIDNSRSMGPKLGHVYTAAVSFTRLSHPDDDLFVVHFNEQVRDGLDGTAPFTSDRERLWSVLRQIRADGMTALYDAVGHALQYADNGRHDQKVLLVLSDGGDNASTRSFDDLERRVAASATMIYTVGLFPRHAPDANPGVLTKLAATSGGDAYFPGEPREIVAILERIAREIRTTYTIGYVPTGGFRKLRVSVRQNGRDLDVRHREGYLAAVERDGAGPDGSDHRAKP
jgi:Ca-activated chloride channel family protein